MTDKKTILTPYPFGEVLKNIDLAKVVKEELTKTGLLRNKNYSKRMLFPAGDHKLMIRHGLGVVPININVMPIKDSTTYFTDWWLYGDPTGEYVYIEASDEGYAIVYIGG